ncbi:defensin [Drosophila innubila]|uniref:defensin n=1 Tax=Drosophila innubila TaxID=198719 RepID=UPI00148DBFC6|nr:defensin [Drosophila innubila]
MKTIVFIGVLVLLVSLAQTYPDFDEVNELEAANPNPANKLNHRQKRGSCNLSPAACFFHCIALGRKGGYCNGSKICICRQ